ncbi:MAG: helix-turn-helix domain-containing protein [Lactobacillus sp.]
MLGEKFRELRKSQNKSISEMAKNITSPSSLRRWECGEGEMSISKVILLLNKLHITPKEFMDIVDTEDDDFYEVEISMYYEKNEVQKLKELIDVSKEYHLEHPANKKYLFRDAIACNYYMDLTGQNLFSEDDVLRLKAYLLPTENWTQENVLLFGNTQLLLPAEAIFEISNSIYSYLFYDESARTFYVMALNTLLNAVFCLIKKKNTLMATKLLRKIDMLNVPSKFTNERIRINFMKALLDYVHTQDSSSMNTFLQSLNSLGFSEKVADFSFAFDQVKAIYSEK